MRDYDKFLDLLENEWNGKIESSNISLDIPISRTFNSKRINPFEALVLDRLNRKLDSNFKVKDSEIVIQLVKSKKIIKIQLYDIINVPCTGFNGEVLLKLKNSDEIIISPHFIKKTLFKYYFTDYFINYIKEHI